MTTKEFDLLISMMLEMLKKGEVNTVIRLLENTRSHKSDDKNSSSNDDSDDE